MSKHPCWKRRIDARLALVLAVLATAIAPQRAIAHGARIDYRSTQALEVQASYDTGEPMANAQVTVYSPENLSEPWLTGMTDDQGRFVFVPDPEMVGSWDVQVRQAGHGDLVSIPLDSTNGPEGGPMAAVSGSSAGVSPAQKALMAGSVIWGLFGTALFFTARAKKNAHS